MRSVEFLDAVRARHGLTSDRKLAAFLELEQPRVASYRTGRRTLDPEACVAVARALELPPEHVFASVQAERAKRTDHRRIWERLAKIAKHAGAAVVLAYAATSAPPASGAPAGHNAVENIHYAAFRRLLAALRERRRRWRPRRRSAGRTRRTVA